MLHAPRQGVSKGAGYPGTRHLYLFCLFPILERVEWKCMFSLCFSMRLCISHRCLCYIVCLFLWLRHITTLNFPSCWQAASLIDFFPSQACLFWSFSFLLLARSLSMASDITTGFCDGVMYVKKRSSTDRAELVLDRGRLTASTDYIRAPYTVLRTHKYRLLLTLC